MVTMDAKASTGSENFGQELSERVVVAAADPTSFRMSDEGKIV
jgi:hypothetical protein